MLAEEELAGRWGQQNEGQKNRGHLFALHVFAHFSEPIAAPMENLSFVEKALLSLEAADAAMARDVVEQALRDRLAALRGRHASIDD